MHDWRVAATGKDDRMTLWRSILAWLAALSAEPAEIDREPPRAAAAVAAAYATFAPDAPAPPAPPAPTECPCGGTCRGTGIYRPDGRIEMRCEAGCATCKRGDPAPCRCGGPCSARCSCGCVSVLERCADGKCAPR